MLKRKCGFYERYIKRMLDILFALLAIIAFFWLYLVIAVVVRLKMGSPVLFSQLRPGLIGKDGKEKIFRMYKFRTMTDKRDENGELLPDQERLPAFGKMLRATSLDELPEAFNILRGDMSIIGPRPQLVRDLVFMDEKQRMRHTAKPGLSGLAQVMGRNAIAWEEKIEWDLKYIEDVSFRNDFRIILQTVKKVFGHNENAAEIDVTDDYGDALLMAGKITQDQYDSLQKKAKELIAGYEREKQ